MTDRNRDWCIAGLAYIAGCLVATCACLVAIWLETHNKEEGH